MMLSKLLIFINWTEVVEAGGLMMSLIIRAQKVGNVFKDFHSVRTRHWKIEAFPTQINKKGLGRML